LLLVWGAPPRGGPGCGPRLVDALLEGCDPSLALDDHTVPPRRRGASDDGDDAVDGDTDGDAAALPLLTTVMNALQSPPFMTPHRVVVLRDVGNLTTDQAKVLAEYLGDPLDTARLVLVAGGGRTPPSLEKAVKAAKGEAVAPAAEKTADVLALELRAAGVALDRDAASLVVEHLGEDAGRVPELVATFAATYGPKSSLHVDDVAPFLGSLGTTDSFAITNALDKGDVAGVLEALHRSLHASSGKQAKPLHPMQVMAMVVGHYQRLLRLDHPSIVTKEQAAEVLGMKNAYAARFRLDAARALGTDGLREAFALLARAELDLRGESGVDDETVLQILLARLARLARRGGAGVSRSSRTRAPRGA
jgi:DNA polymerase-3 subunit delta